MTERIDRDPHDAAGWSQQTERSSPGVMALMRWIATRLGRPIARLVLHPISLYFLCFGGPAGRASRAYLERVLGRRPRLAERYRHIHSFAATILDRVYLLQERFDLFDIEVVGVEHVDAVHAQGRGALLVGAHMGSFEVLRAIGDQRRDLRVAMVMYEENARQINSTLRALAPEHEIKVIALGRLGAMLELRRWLDEGGVAGVLADRAVTHATQRGQPHWLPLLGAPAAFADGPFRLAALLRRPMVFMVGLYLGGARYQLRFVPLADFSGGAASSLPRTVDDALSAYVAQLDALCREMPYNWFNFFDFWAGADAGETTDGPSPPPAP